MKKNCKICGNEFEAVKSAKTCSDECSDVNKKNRKQSIPSREKYRNTVKERSIELSLSQNVISEYGYDFIKSNPLVYESLLLQKNLSGRKFLSPEVKEARDNARVKPMDIYYRKEHITIKQCLVCGGDFRAIGLTKTCSDVCGSEMIKKNAAIGSKKWAKDPKNKESVKASKKKSDDKRYELIKQIAKECNTTTRDARNILIERNRENKLGKSE
jgi:predicted nucleic acid-binding Zn ribbon protein